MGEDGEGDWWQEIGGPTFVEVERDGSVQLSAAAASSVRHFQELRGPLSRGLHGRQRRGDARQGHFMRAQGGGCRRRQKEVSLLKFPLHSRIQFVCTALLK